MVLNLTPRPVVRQGLIYLRDQMGVLPKVVLDPSAGAGVFGAVSREVWPQAHLIGLEPDPDMAELAKANYDVFCNCTLEAWLEDTTVPLDHDSLVTTNPPFEKFARLVDLEKGGPKKLESWIPKLLDLAPLVWLYGKEAVGNRIQAHELLFETRAPVHQARVGGYIRHRGKGVGSDSHAYAWWLWARAGTLRDHVTGWLPEALAEMPEGAYPAVKLRRLSAKDRTWKGAMPGQEQAA